MEKAPALDLGGLEAIAGDLARPAVAEIESALLEFRRSNNIITITVHFER